MFTLNVVLRREELTGVIHKEPKKCKKIGPLTKYLIDSGLSLDSVSSCSSRSAQVSNRVLGKLTKQPVFH